MKYKNYTDLGIVSAQLAENTHLFIETNSSGTLYMVDSVDETLIYKTTDKGDNWTQPSGDFDRANDVQMFWHDRGNDILYCCDAQNVFSIDLTDDTVTELGLPDVTGEGYASGDAWDIFMIGADLYCGMLSIDATPHTGYLIYKWNDPNWDYKAGTADGAQLTVWYGYAIIISTKVYFTKYDGTNSFLNMMVFDSTVPSLTKLDQQTARSFPSNKNPFAMAYDGSNLLYFVAEATADNKNYLHTYNITGDVISTSGEFNVALMLDRNTDSVQEKAYHLTEYKVYQLQENKIQLNLISLVDSDAAFIV